MNAREVIAAQTGDLDEADRVLAALAREGYEVVGVTTVATLTDRQPIGRCGDDRCPCRQM